VISLWNLGLSRTNIQSVLSCRIFFFYAMALASGRNASQYFISLKRREKHSLLHTKCGEENTYTFLLLR